MRSVRVQSVTVLVLQVVHVRGPLLRLSMLSCLRQQGLEGRLLRHLTFDLVAPRCLEDLRDATRNVRNCLIVRHTAYHCNDSLARESLFQARQQRNCLPFNTQRLLRVIRVRLDDAFCCQVPLPRRDLITHVRVVLPRVNNRPNSTVQRRTPLHAIRQAYCTPSVDIVVYRPTATTVRFPDHLYSHCTRVLSRQVRELHNTARVHCLNEPMIRLHVSISNVFAIPEYVFTIIPGTLRIYHLSAELKEKSRRVTAVIVRRYRRHRVLTTHGFLRTLVNERQDVSVN